MKIAPNAVFTLTNEQAGMSSNYIYKLMSFGF